MPLKKGKKVIACPRLEKYEEHVDDHQLQITEVFSEEGYILLFNDGDDMDKIYKKSLSFKPKKYVSNTEKFIKNIKEIIDKD
jgi:UDP-N-acetylglucosamine transferase subunit ALG13